MPYRYVTKRSDYSDLASGRVFYHLPGHPVFPVRLASEVFLRAIHLLEDQASSKTVCVYDPCCGNAYLLCVLAFLHGEKISEIIASDVDPDVLVIAHRNLRLLTREGLAHRRTEIIGMAERYGKASHVQALESVDKLLVRLEGIKRVHAIQTGIFQADVLQSLPIRNHIQQHKVNLVITDIPYGRASNWELKDRDHAMDPDQSWQMLETLRSVLVTGAIVAVASAKGEKIAHDHFQPAGKMRAAGKRLITFLRLS